MTSNDLVQVGGESVSFQAVQSIYKSVTGRTERITRTVKTPYIFYLQNIDALHREVERALEQYREVASDLNIVARFSDGRSETFSSYVRFSAHRENFYGVTESISLSYSLLIELPRTQAVNHHTLSVIIISTLGENDRIQRDTPGSYDARTYLEDAHITLIYNIDYVDYAVARNLQAIVERWTTSVSEEVDNTLHKVARLAAGGASAGLAIGSLFVMLSFVLSRDITASSLALLHSELIRSVSYIVIGTMIGGFLGFLLERWFKHLRPASCIVATENDTRLLRAHRHTITKVVFSGSVAILLGITSSIAAAYLYDANLFSELTPPSPPPEPPSAPTE